MNLHANHRRVPGNVLRTRWSARDPPSIHCPGSKDDGTLQRCCVLCEVATFATVAKMEFRGTSARGKLNKEGDSTQSSPRVHTQQIGYPTRRMDFSAPCMSGSWRGLGTTCLFSVKARCRYKSSTSEAEKTHSSLTLP